MKELVVLLVCLICITPYENNGLKLIEVPKEYIKRLDIRSRIYQTYKIKPYKHRSFKYQYSRRQAVDQVDEAKDKVLKEKIGFLIDQTINDAVKNIEAIQPLKMRYNSTPGYQLGYLMYMVKRSREVMDDLFTIAINHKDDWKALDQLKIFELIVHTNVDTSNLLRQLLDISTRYPKPSAKPPTIEPGGGYELPEGPAAARLKGLRFTLLKKK